MPFPPPSKTACISLIARRWCRGLDEIIALRMKGLLGCALSGAGPSILVFYQRGYEHVCPSVQHIFTAHGKDSEVMLTELATKGSTNLAKDSWRPPTGWPHEKKVRIFCGMPTIQWIGIPGVKMPSKKRAARICPSSCRSVIPPATGAT